jgi:hypothetical protein
MLDPGQEHLRADVPVAATEGIRSPRVAVLAHMGPPGLIVVWIIFCPVLMCAMLFTLPIFSPAVNTPVLGG